MSPSKCPETGNITQVQMVPTLAPRPVVPDSPGRVNHTMYPSCIGKPFSQKKASIFALFPCLPLELREGIWEIASNEPQLVEGRYDYRNGVWSSANVPPSVLYTCHESRRVALKS